MGDSSAAALDAGNMIQGLDVTCLRHDGAYLVLLDANLQPHPSRFTSVSCSGDKSPTILQKQLQPAYLRPRGGDRQDFMTFS